MPVVILERGWSLLCLSAVDFSLGFPGLVQTLQGTARLFKDHSLLWNLFHQTSIYGFFLLIPLPLLPPEERKKFSSSHLASDLTPGQQTQPRRCFSDAMVRVRVPVQKASTCPRFYQGLLPWGDRTGQVWVPLAHPEAAEFHQAQVLQGCLLRSCGSTGILPKVSVSN